MEVIKHKKEVEETSIERYYLYCKCGCEFIANWDESCGMDKCIENANIYFKCPECGEVVKIKRCDFNYLLEYKNNRLIK